MHQFQILKNEAIPSKEDIIKALNLCNTKYQAIILLMSSSGISVGDVLNLKVSDFLNGLNVPQNQQDIEILIIIMERFTEKIRSQCGMFNV